MGLLIIQDCLFSFFINIKKSDTHSFNISGIVEDTQRNVCVKVVKEKI